MILQRSTMFAGFGLVVLVLIGIANYYSTHRAIGDSGRVAHTHEVLEAISELLSNLQDAETGQRGYILTGKMSYLDPYETAISSVGRSLAQVRYLTVDNLRQQRKLAALPILVSKKLDELRLTINLRQTKGFVAAQALVLTHSGKYLMDDIRTLIYVIETEERVLLQQRKNRFEQNVRINQWVLVVGMILGISLFLTAGYLFFRESLKRKNAESRQHAILENMIDGMISINEQGVVESINPAAQAIFGYAEAEVVGNNVSMLMPEPHRGQHDGYLKRYLETGEARIVGSNREISCLRKDGSVFPMNMALTEQVVDGEKIFTAGLRDITEWKQVEADIRVALLKAERANQAKSQFLASMSHELRTPLNAVIGLAQLYEYDKNLEEQHKARAKQILNAGKHLLSLINEVLDLTKIESGQVDLSLKPIDISSALEECQTLTGSIIWHYTGF